MIRFDASLGALVLATIAFTGCDDARRLTGGKAEERYDARRIEALSAKSFCSEELEGTSKDSCLEELAVRLRSTSLCLQTSQKSVAPCLETLARETGDATPCATIEDERLRRACVEYTLRGTRSSNSCVGLKEPERIQCADFLVTTVLASWSVDPFFLDCAIYGEGTKQQLCRWQLALFTGDTTPCDAIGDSAARRTCELLARPEDNLDMACPPEVHEACIRRLAPVRPWRCFELDGAARKACLAGATQGPGDVSQCGALRENERALCTASYAILLANPFVCGALEGEAQVACARLGDEFGLDLRVCLLLPEGLERTHCAEKRREQIDRTSYCALLPIHQRAACESRLKLAAKAP